MKLVSGVLGFTLASVAAVASANAADMYRPAEGVSLKDAPLYLPWNGAYIGVNGGYGWSAKDNSLKGSAQAEVCEGSGEFPECGTITGTGAKTFGAAGGFGGGQIGYNIQRSHFVFGVEADIQAAAINGDATLSLLGGAASASAKSDLDWFGTLRGRAGLAFDNTLFYFTGGFAAGGVKDSLTVKPAIGAASTVSASDTKTGYVLGGGAEHLFNQAWSVKAEYQYLDLGADKLSASAGVAPFGAAATLDAEHSYHTVRLGLNYHLNSYDPLK
jgi:outer membrane immunogenic protein